MEYFYPLIGKCALTKPEEQGGGRQILYREPGKAAEPGQSRGAGDSLQQLRAGGGAGHLGWVQGTALQDWGTAGPTEEPGLA